MTRHRWGAALLVAATLVAASCGRGDDSSDTTAAPASTTASDDCGSGDDRVERHDSSRLGHDRCRHGRSGGDDRGADDHRTGDAEGYTLTAADIADECASEPLEATETGVSESEITIEVMADTGSQLSPGFGQGSVDAVEAFADYINANGGVGLSPGRGADMGQQVRSRRGEERPDRLRSAQHAGDGRQLLRAQPRPVADGADASTRRAMPTGLPNVAALGGRRQRELLADDHRANSRRSRARSRPNTDRDFVRWSGRPPGFVERSPRSTARRLPRQRRPAVHQGVGGPRHPARRGVPASSGTRRSCRALATSRAPTSRESST